MRENRIRIAPMQSSTRIALLGNPNSGKTTLFNRLTGLSRHVGNYPGITVELSHAQAQADRAIDIVDMPGMYSLTPVTDEERVGVNALFSHPPDGMLSVVDATCPQRGLYLTLQLLETGLPMAVVLTMMDEVESSGGSVDIEALSRLLSVPVFSARHTEPLAMLRAATSKQRSASAPSQRMEPTQQVIQQRYARIDVLYTAAFVGPEESLAQARARRIDAIATHRLWCFPLFALIMGAIFFISFGPVGSFLQQAFAALMDALSSAMDGALRRFEVLPWVRSLITEGILAGLSSVLSFLPTIALLFGLISILEDSGYMARMSFCMDAPLAKLSLSGRSFVPLLVGFGCSVPAIMATRTLASRRDRLLTMLLIPFMSCSAKAPIYALFANAFMPQHRVVIMLCIYMVGIVAGIVCMMLLRRVGVQGDSAPFLLELPAYRMPSARSVALRVWAHLSKFLRGALSLLLLSSVAIWALSRVTPGLSPAQSSEQSLLAMLGRGIAPAFLPLGFSDWRTATALLSGLMAKENIIASLGVLYGATAGTPLTVLLPACMEPLSAVSFVLFTLLYVPCVAAFAAVRRECGGRIALRLAVFQTGVAWLFCCAVYNLLRLVM